MTDTLRIRLRDSPDGDSGHLLEADKLTLQYWSSCARGLPAAAEEWDLSQLLLERQPVQRITVVCWLNAIFQHGDNKPMFEGHPDSPEHTMAGLAQLLSFADAVGTREGLLAVLDAQVSAAGLVATVQMGEQQLQLAADSCYCFRDSKPLELWCVPAGNKQKVATASSAADKNALQQQLMQQVEALLYLAYKLQLPQLQCVVHRGGQHRRQLLKPLDLTAAHEEPIQFKAEVVEDFACFEKGQTVNVEMDLFNWSEMYVTPDAPGATKCPFGVNLSLGRQLQLQSGA